MPLRPLPVTRQRWDSGGSESGRVLPVGNQLHHLGLQGHSRGVHGWETAGLAMGSAQALQEGGNRAPALGRSTAGAGLDSHKSCLHQGHWSWARHQRWWHGRDRHPAMSQASPGPCFSLLPARHKMSRGAQPQLQSPSRVPRRDCPFPQQPSPFPRPQHSPARHCPARESPSTPPAHLHCPARSSRLRDSVSPPADGASRREGLFGRAAEDGLGSSGTPQAPLCKARGAARHEGLTQVPPLPGCRGGGSGHVRAAQTEQERARGRETAPWQGKAAELPSAGRLGTLHKAASVRAPGLPAPLGNGTGWLFLGHAGSRGRVSPPPTAPGGLGSCPAGQGAPQCGYARPRAAATRAGWDAERSPVPGG